jgi:hypothetical protein
MRIRELLVLILTAGVGGSVGYADAQVPYPGQKFPPAGYPRRTTQPLPNTHTGPSNSLVAPGFSTQPGGASPSLSGTSRMPTTVRTPTTPLPSPYTYWSPGTAAWDIQERLGRLGPLRAGQDVPAQGPATAAGRPADFGLSGSQLGLDALAQFGATSRVITQEVPSEAGAAGTTSPTQPPEQIENGLNIPFEQFESYEEFRAWLTEQLAQPGGGAVGQALTRLDETDQSTPTGMQSPQQREPVRWGERPPIGYVGVGGNARTPLGSFSVGSDAAYDSSRLVAELNQYLQSRRLRPPGQAGTVDTSPGQPTVQGALPPPRSNLGRRLERSRLSGDGYPSARGAPALAPTPQPRQYYQNLGGYTPPQPALDWLPPGGGY